MIILKFLLLVFVFALVGAAMFLLSVWRRVRDGVRRFTEQQAGRQGSVGGDTVVDRRSPEQAARKIIPDDEGEYVDFTETD